MPFNRWLVSSRMVAYHFWTIFVVLSVYTPEYTGEIIRREKVATFPAGFCEVTHSSTPSGGDGWEQRQNKDHKEDGRIIKND